MKTYLLSIFFTLYFHYNSNAQSQADSSGTQDTPKTQSRSGKKNAVKNKAYVFRSQSYLNDVARMEEGYTALERGAYIIKDYLVKGTVNLICVTYGVALASGNVNSGESSKRYYLQRESENNVVREVFLTKKHTAIGNVSKVLAGSGQTYRGMLNTRKSSGSMVEVSKAVLTEMMQDNRAVVESIAKITKVTAGSLKKVVKQYNAVRTV